MQPGAEEPVPFLDLRSIHSPLIPDLLAAQERVLRSGWFLLGPELEAFEAAYASWVGTRHCIGVGSGLAALELSLEAAGIGEGDEVIVPGFTFVATWLAVSRCGAIPVPVEADPRSANLDPATLEDAISDRTRAILPVHLYGRSVEMGPLQEVASRHGLFVLEDAAQAHGAMWNGQKVGTLGNAAAWSFYPGKNLGALGDGGAITTDDDDLARKLRVLRNYGSERKYEHLVMGRNSRLDEIQSACLRVKLGALDGWNARRREIAGRYLDGPAARLNPPSAPGDPDSAVWHLMVVRHPERERLQEGLSSLGIQTLCHYPLAPHQQPVYQELPWKRRPLPVSEELAASVFSLPMGPHLADEQVDRISAGLEQLLR